MTHGSLFSGIGGFDLAAEWMGWENKFHCEWNEFGQKVLKHYWPEAESFHDITKTNFTKYANRIDILTGGFPCQPYSMAGKRKGKEDERHLWPEMLRCIREVKPRWVVGENVLGLVNWSGGLVFHEVQADLEAEGYEVFPYVLPAASVNAPHRRDRVWFVAYNSNGWIKKMHQRTKYKNKTKSTSNSNNNGLHKCDSGDEIKSSERGVNALGNIDESNGNGDASDSKCLRLEHSEETRNIREGKTKTQRERSQSSEPIETNGINRNATNTNNKRLQRSKVNGIAGASRQKSNKFTTRCIRSNWQNFPTVSPICDGDDGLSNRLDSITFSKWRKESIKAGGNAIVPQVALQIFKTIQQYESRTN
jgi:DNA (cytosine-5)-methyltransferase 1